MKQYTCSMSKKKESLAKKSEATKFIDSKIDALVAEISDKYGFTLKEKTRPGWETSWYLAKGNTLGHMADGKIAIWINGFRPNGEFLNLGYKVGKGDASSSGKDIRTFDTLKKNLLADCDKYFGAGASESKKSEDASSVDDLLARHNQKWLVKVSYDVDASHSAVAPSIVRADTKDAATKIALKRHSGLGYNMKVVSVEPMTESRKKSEGISDMIDAKIDYNMFMRMCETAAYLEEDEDYWDALWDFYSEVGNIGDALVFFDNLFQYTAWKDVDETYDELDESDQDGSKSKEECIEAVLDRDGEIRGSYVRNYGDHYLWVY